MFSRSHRKPDARPDLGPPLPPPRWFCCVLPPLLGTKIRSLFADIIFIDSLTSAQQKNALGPAVPLMSKWALYEVLGVWATGCEKPVV